MLGAALPQAREVLATVVWRQRLSARSRRPPSGDRMNIIEQRNDPAAFRQALRDWLARTVPSDWQARMTGASDEDFRAFQHWWFKELVGAGLATPHWPAA